MSKENEGQSVSQNNENKDSLNSPLLDDSQYELVRSASILVNQEVTSVTGWQFGVFGPSLEAFTLSLNEQIESFADKYFIDKKGIQVISGINGKYLSFAVDVDYLKKSCKMDDKKRY